MQQAIELRTAARPFLDLVEAALADIERIVASPIAHRVHPTCATGVPQAMVHTWERLAGRLLSPSARLFRSPGSGIDRWRLKRPARARTQLTASACARTPHNMNQYSGKFHGIAKVSRLVVYERERRRVRGFLVQEQDLLRDALRR